MSIPTYNHEKYIARAIESVLAQRYSNLEVVVSDDCSTDGTFDIARRYTGGKVKVTRTPRNLGRVENYRRCLYELTSGDWAVNLDGDDFYDDPTFFSAAMEALGEHREAVLYAAGSKGLDDAHGTVRLTPLRVSAELTVMDGSDYVLGWPELGASQHFAVIYNRGMALETNFYVLDSLGADTDSLCRLALKGKVLVANKHVGVWTRHGRNASYTVEQADYGHEVAMLRHIAAPLREQVGSRVADAWLRDRIAMKNRFFTQLMIQKGPIGTAWSRLLRTAKPDLFHAKEAVKLVLRSAGLR
ncbi:glycosyltransferase family 2 protein [Sphingomonas segetis]|uniref:glycosyltransferase family 2 protein n=1 Tax=Sphingomonas segetis TaxID=1104779 RepID=UPI0018AD3D4F|nr:glycosyltransferase family 2 protein [Sphingomonas segetis]